MSTHDAIELGAHAFHAESPRIMPLADFLNEDGTMDKIGAAAWYRGWDRANLAVNPT